MGDVLGRVMRPVFGAVLATAIATASAWAADPRPASPQPAAGSLKSGLSVVYYPTFVRLIEELEEFMDENSGQRGKALRNLNYQTGERGALTSGIPHGVGADIQGLIKFAETGTYSMVVNSNDGFRLSIGGKFILEDPGVHPDQYSGIAKLNIAEPGWYDFHMLYFQRKGTSTLQLFWTPPSGSKMVVVPAEAFGHR